MTEIISHPGKPLIVHLREVARLCFQTLGDRVLPFEISPEVIKTLGFIQGCAHDIGKATKNFQKYIKSNGQIVIKPKHHALISAYLARELAIKYLSQTDVSAFDKDLLPYFIFTAVKRHHGNVKNFDDELETLRKQEDDLRLQVDNFYDEEVQSILSELLAEIRLEFQWNDFKVYMKSLNSVFEEFEDFSNDFMSDEFGKLAPERKVDYFYLHHLFFSTLLFSDKTDVILLEERNRRNLLFDFDAITSFRERKGFLNPTSEINQLKNKAYLEGIENLHQIFVTSQHFYSLTLPTGLGKTITSLGVAMEMKKLLQVQNPRIIISIPFTSIIDQNYEVFNEIFNSPDSSILLKHHHLAEPKYKTDEDTVKDKSSDESKFLIETWQSEIVVTTFVQLIEGIFTNNKSKLLKLPNLVNSIIILDEIQQIKYELWELIRTAFRVLAERYNCYFILMSATQPLIFEPEKEICEIIPNYKQYFKFFNRTMLVNKTNDIVSLEEFSKVVIAYHNQNPKKNILVILNTKKITLDCFNKIKEQIIKENANLYFLTTMITPFERKKIIDRIKNPINNLPNIVISTQLIEAGVDISVDVVFRALAPLDSIIQAAGRANRYYENREPCEVFLYKITELEKLTNRIYGADLILKTSNVLENIESIQENEYLRLIEAYFIEVRKQSDNHLSKELESLLKLDFEDLGNFEFIVERKTESVFIQIDQKAKASWKDYAKIYGNETLSTFEKKAAFALIKAKFYDYVVNVPVPYGEKSIEFDSEPIIHFYLSKLEEPSKLYSYKDEDFRNNTGYVKIKVGTLNF